MGPLAGIKVLELKGLGPGPYAGMVLAALLEVKFPAITIERL